jgi:dolichyl-phosphate-mannose--protein O-mannosyl transferase
MKEYKLLVFLGLISIIFCHDDEYHTTPEDIKEAISSRVITYGSVVRIQNYNSQYFLHSHDIKYGSGS